MKYSWLLLLVLFCSHSFGQHFDIDLLRSLNQNRNTSLDGSCLLAAKTVATISIGMPLIVYASGLAAKQPTWQRKALVIAASVSLTMTTATLTKYTVNRERPYVAYPDIIKTGRDEGTPAFPSGHTASAFSTATSLSIAFPRWYVIAPAYAWAGFVGYARMHSGVHYPTDVLVGALIGSGSAWVCDRVNKKMFGVKQR